MAYPCVDPNAPTAPEYFVFALNRSLIAASVTTR